MYLFYIDESGNTGRDPDFEFHGSDALLRQLTRSRPVQRLRRIGFLGAIDRIKSRSLAQPLRPQLGRGTAGASLRQEPKPLPA